MNILLRSFGLSLRDIFHPRIVWLSIRPFAITGLLWLVILWFSWTPMLDFTKQLITESWLTQWLADLIVKIGWDGFRGVLSPYLALVVLMPLLVVSLLMIVSLTTTDAVLGHVSRQNTYREMESLQGGSLLGSVWLTIWATGLCLLGMLITLPFWWIPPLFAFIPPIIWGWLTARLMSYDVLALHASSVERSHLMRLHRWQLLGMGIGVGLLGAVPTFFWFSSIFMLVMFPFVSIFMLWVYSLVFIFAALWFSHYLLFALKQHRQLQGESI